MELQKYTWRLCELFIQFSPMVTPDARIVKYQNQYTDIDMVHSDYLNFTSFTCSHLCAFDV
jgi:hypothetical protein